MAKIFTRIPIVEIVLFIVLLTVFVFLVMGLSTKLKEAGRIRGLVIKAGIEVKSIAEEINKEEK